MLVASMQEANENVYLCIYMCKGERVVPTKRGHMHL